MTDVEPLLDALIAEIDPAPHCDRAKLRSALRQFFAKNSGKSADDLASIAAELMDGRSLHSEGVIVQLVRSRVLFPCPWLTAAAVYNKWKGGKMGFQFLPDPAEVDIDEYLMEVDDLLSVFDYWDATESAWDPRHVLTAEDRNFFDSLPDRITIYRGGGNVSAEKLAAGVCWTTSRPVAEWFAMRTQLCRSAGPVLISATIPKRTVYLAFNSECEIVARPYRWRAIKPRLRKGRRGRAAKAWRPRMEWASQLAC